MLDREVMQCREDDIVSSLVAGLAPTELPEGLDGTLLYPEYTFLQPYAVWTGHVPIYAVLPFFKQLIVHLDPFRDDRSFQRAYGLSIEEMVELRERGRLILLMRTAYGRYPEFYDALLKRHTPLNNRVERAYITSRDAEISEYRGILNQRFQSKNVPLPIPLEEELTHKVGESQVRDLALSTMAHRMAKLSVIGLRERAIEVVETRTFSQAYEDLHRYNRALACPLIDALGGWDNLDAAHIELLNGIPVGEQSKRQLIIPRDILFWLNQQMGYSFPTQVQSGTSYLEVVEQADEAAQNHEILLALQDMFEHSDLEASYDIADRSRRVIAGLEKHLAAIRRTKSSFEKWISRPLRYASLATSPVAFALMEKSLSSGDLEGTLAYGALGIGTDLLREHIQDIERFLVSLRHKRSAVPTMIWNRTS